jgi:hypothetical protein
LALAACFFAFTGAALRFAAGSARFGRRAGAAFLATVAGCFAFTGTARRFGVAFAGVFLARDAPACLALAVAAFLPADRRGAGLAALLAVLRAALLGAAFFDAALFGAALFGAALLGAAFFGAAFLAFLGAAFRAGALLLTFFVPTFFVPTFLVPTFLLAVLPAFRLVRLLTTSFFLAIFVVYTGSSSAWTDPVARSPGPPRTTGPPRDRPGAQYWISEATS